MLFAALSQDTDHLQALLDIGIDINAKNAKGYTPLMFASAYNNPKIVNFLIQKGADKTARAYVLDMNALHVAAYSNPNPDVIDALTKHGFDTEVKTENDYTALLIAVTENRNLEVAERLVKKGADKSAYDENGKSAYILAKKRMEGSDKEYYRISSKVDERVLIKLQAK